MQYAIATRTLCPVYLSEWRHRVAASGAASSHRARRCLGCRLESERDRSQSGAAATLGPGSTTHTGFAFVRRSTLNQCGRVPRYTAPVLVSISIVLPEYRPMPLRWL
ncbi:unnamed protein product, partial [Iphiclides podalirius]